MTDLRGAFRTMRHVARRFAGLAGVAAIFALAPASALAASPPGLPPGAAAAALRPLPQLPKPSGWSFPEAFPSTAGTGRLARGALDWTDFVYDDYGANATTAGSAPPNTITSGPSALGPARGQYVYPAGKADEDGADILHAAVGITRSDTVWRIDWNTLVDRRIPIAEWTFDTDDNARTGATRWPAGANVSSPGIERALVVSARGARLLNASTGATLATFPTSVDSASRSFIVRIPRRTMPVRGRWRVRLAAGLADAAGTGFAVPVMSTGGSAPATASRIYNITFRAAGQEPPHYAGDESGELAQRLRNLLGRVPAAGEWAEDLPNTLAANFWNEDHQADALAAGDVSAFSVVVDWRQLLSRRTTRPALVKGWSTHLIVNPLHLGQGVTSSLYAGRVQPYAVYVPPSYTGRSRVPLTWLIHSASSQYNQYAALDPRLTAAVCVARQAICATPNGFGGSTPFALQEYEMWQIWRALAQQYRLAPDRTIMTGYSEGGVASYRWPITYPSAFAAAMPLDGGFDEGCSSLGPNPGVGNFDFAAAADRAGNVRWVPYVVASGYTDELSAYPGVLDQAQRFLAAGDRFTLFSTTTPEHVTTALADGFSTIAAALPPDPYVKLRPATIDYSWCPENVDRKLGLGPTSVYWLSGLSQRSARSGATMSRIVADDEALPDPAVTQQVTNSVVVAPDAPPMHELQNRWLAGNSPAARPLLRLSLTNVRSLTVDTAMARLPTGTATVASDGTTTITLADLPGGSTVRATRGGITARSGRSVTVRLPPGKSTLTWGAASGG
jgi:hypothetical protein